MTAPVPAPIVINGMIHRGGRIWSCERCDTYVAADCECCEPPRCACSRERRR